MIFEFTPDERAKLEAIDGKELAALKTLFELFEKYGVDSPKAKAAKKEYTSGANEREKEFSRLVESMDASRFSALKTPEDILKDAEHQASDAIRYLLARAWRSTPEKDKKPGNKSVVDFASGSLLIHPLYWDYTKELAQIKEATQSILLDVDGTISIILREVLARHIEALDGTPHLLRVQEAVTRIVKESEFTIDSRSVPVVVQTITTINADSSIFNSNMLMFHGKPISALASFNSTDIVHIDKEFNTAIIRAKGYAIELHDFENLKGKLSTNTHKLLSTGISEFTKVNSYGAETISLEVHIPFKEYCRHLGYEIDARETDSPEAAIKEEKRVSEVIRTARKRINQDLHILRMMDLSWEDYSNVAILQHRDIKNGYIIMEFSNKFAEYLITRPITQYPRSLLSVDARNDTAYLLGLKMSEHYNIDNNQKIGTANRLKVKTLLSVTRLPTMDSLRNEKTDNSRQWRKRIKEPFESAMNYLTGKVISEWSYVLPDGAKLGSEEAKALKDYDAFLSLLVKFDFIDAPEHSERIARRSEEKKGSAAKKSSRGKRTR